MDIKSLASGLMKKHGIAPAEDPKAMGADDDGDSDGPSQDQLDAAQDLLDAIHSHDAAGLASAWDNMNSISNADTGIQGAAGDSGDQGGSPEEEDAS